MAANLRAASQASAAATPLSTKLARLVALSPVETAALSALQSSTRAVSRNREIITAGRKYDGVFVLIDGAAIRYRVLRDGRRQILNIALPGDFIGFPASFFEAALYSITALNDALVSWVPFPTLFGLFQKQPRRAALERVAHFLLELLTRLQAIGLADERSYRMPLTQELIGDALGLSVPHVNRTLRQLREDGLIGIDGQIVAIRDLEALAALADFEKAYLGGFRIGELL